MVAELKLVASRERLIEQTYRTTISVMEQRIMFAEQAEKLNGETIAIQQQEIHRLESREREVAVILATALACGGYQSQHGHWIKDAAAWLSARQAS